MKILHIVFSLATGGAQKLLSDLVPEQKALGCDVEILVYKLTDSHFEKILTEKKINIISLGINNIKSIKIISRIRRYLPNYDVIHVHLFPCIYQVAIANIGINKKLVYTEHSTHNRRRNHKLLKIVEQWVYKKYDKVIAISNSASFNLLKWLNCNRSKIIVIPNGINLENSIINIEPIKEFISKNVVLMVSRFTDSKDQETLIRAIPYLSDNNLIVAFAGDGDTIEYNKQISRELGVFERCLFLGNRSDVKSLIASSLIGVQSSNWEGFGITTLEFMAMHKPIIASDVDGLKQVVAGAGLIFPHKDYQALAKIINELIEDNKYYRYISDKCLNRSKEYDISKIAQEYIDIYQNNLNYSAEKL